MMNTLKEFNDYLTEKDWTGDNKHFKLDDTHRWYKKFKTDTPCETNGQGIQIVIEGYDMSRLDHNLKGLSFTVALRAESRDEAWVDFKYYGLSDTQLVEKLDDYIEKLLYAWEAINE